MKELFNIYKIRIFGFFISIIGASFLFGTFFYLAPYFLEDKCYFDVILSSLKYTSIIFTSFIVLGLGIGFLTKDESAKELIDNFKKALK